MADNILGNENAEFGLNRFRAIFRVEGHDESQGQLPSATSEHRSWRRSSEQSRVGIRQFYLEGVFGLMRVEDTNLFVRLIHAILCSLN